MTARCGVATPGWRRSTPSRRLDLRALDRLLAPGDGRVRTGPAGRGLPKQDLLFGLRIGQLVGAFLLLERRRALVHSSAIDPCRALLLPLTGRTLRSCRWRAK